MTKSEIFGNLVGSLGKGPRWFCLKEMLSKMVSYDVLEGSAFNFDRLQILFFDILYFLGICMAILRFWVRNT